MPVDTIITGAGSGIGKSTAELINLFKEEAKEKKSKNFYKKTWRTQVFFVSW